MRNTRRLAFGFLVIGTLSVAGCSDDRPGVFASDAAVAATDLGGVDAAAVDSVSTDVVTMEATATDTPGMTAEVAIDAGVIDVSELFDTGAAMDTGSPVGPVDTGIRVDTGVDVPRADAVACGPTSALCPVTGGSPVCTDLQTDHLNCGRCGGLCCDDGFCAGGVCVLRRCTGLRTICPVRGTDPRGCVGVVCVDTYEDDANCGMCGRACSSKQQCVSGRCI